MGIFFEKFFCETEGKKMPSKKSDVPEDASKVEDNANNNACRSRSRSANKKPKAKGVQSLVPDPENDRNRRNARRRNAERDVPLAHAVAPRAERAAEEVDPRAEWAA